jgi:Sec-independent protein translocase protein TatA
VCLVLLVVLVVVIVRLDRAARDLRDAAGDFRDQAEPALAELRAAVRSADFELDRIDAIVTGAGMVTGRVDAASDLAYRTFTSPVVKALAVGTGTRRAVQRLKGDPPRRARDRKRAS